MRLIQFLLIAIFLFSAAQTFAHGDDKNGPCAAYKTTCETDATVTAAGTDKKAKWKAIGECISTAAKADTANGQKCLDAQAKFKGKHHHDDGDKDESKE